MEKDYKKKIHRVMRMKNLYYCGDFNEEMEELLSFEAGLRTSVEKRMRESFISIDEPGLDGKTLFFSSNERYQEWCEKNLPSWLGYGRKK